MELFKYVMIAEQRDCRDFMMTVFGKMLLDIPKLVFFNAGPA